MLALLQAHLPFCTAKSQVRTGAGSMGVLRRPDRAQGQLDAQNTNRSADKVRRWDGFTDHVNARFGKSPTDFVSLHRRSIEERDAFWDGQT